MAITTADVMTTGVFSLDPDMTLHAMDTMLVKSGVSGAPVVEGNRLVGVASQSDVIRTLWAGQQENAHPAPYYSTGYAVPLSALEYMARDAASLGDALVSYRVRDVMTPDPVVAHPEESIESVARRMMTDHIHRLPVVDEETGALVGIVTSLDLAGAIANFGLRS